MSDKIFYGQLEGLRGMAIFLVLLSHFIVIDHFPQLIFLKLGYWGVNIFFVLSGFLISEILFKEIEYKNNKKTILKNFYIKRTLRIFPIYYLVVLGLSLFKIENTEKILPFTLTYTYNIGRIWFNADSKILYHFWSLCVEEQFYMFWPILLLIIIPKYHKYLILSLITVSILVKILYFSLNGINGADFFHASTPACIDALALGALLAYLKRNYSAFLLKLLKFHSIPITVALSFWSAVYYWGVNSFFYEVLGRLLCGFVGFYLVALGTFSIKTVLGDLLNTAFFRFLGRISYGVYVYHWVIYFFLKDFFYSTWSNWDFSFLPVLKYHAYIGSFIFFTALTIFVSSISYYIIEQPLLKLKHNIYK